VSQIALQLQLLKCTATSNRNLIRICGRRVAAVLNSRSFGFGFAPGKKKVIRQTAHAQNVDPFLKSLLNDESMHAS
jgi:hypothetical protein